jgi:hypothetical protein
MISFQPGDRVLVEDQALSDDGTGLREILTECRVIECWPGRYLVELDTHTAVPVPEGTVHPLGTTAPPPADDGSEDPEDGSHEWPRGMGQST